MLKQNKYSIIFNDNHKTDFSLENIQKKANENNCEYFVKGELSALGDLIIVSVSLYETSTSELVWSDLMKAKFVEDLDPILSRISKVIGTKNKASEESDIYDVSEYESNELNRYVANSNFGLFIGGTYTFMDDVEQNVSEGFGAILSYDTRDLILEAKGELYFSDIDHYLISIDLLKPLLPKRNTYYVGFGLGYGGTQIAVEKPYTYNNYSDITTTSYDSGGLILQAHGGYIINRNSNVNFRVNLTPFVCLYQVNDKTPFGFKFYLALLFD